MIAGKNVVSINAAVPTSPILQTNSEILTLKKHLLLLHLSFVCVCVWGVLVKKIIWKTSQI